MYSSYIKKYVIGRQLYTRKTMHLHNFAHFGTHTLEMCIRTQKPGLHKIALNRE